ncbi:MAG TPA: hypothetical protein VHD32_12345 [Candidatus Didemnitutus sp.]|nr:hypothetical protein [Candidatus Didemnitutus sp.]
MKACRHCYTSNPDDARACRSCGHSLRRAHIPTTLIILLLVAGGGGAIWHFRQLPPPAPIPPVPATPAKTQTQPPSEAAAPVATDAPAAEVAEKPPTPVETTPGGPEVTDKTAAPAPVPAVTTSPPGPKPRKHVATAPDTGDILRGDDHFRLVGNVDEAEAKYEAAIWRSMLVEIARIENFWSRAGTDRLHLMLRVDSRGGDTQLINSSIDHISSLRRELAIAAARCSGSVACPDEVVRHFGPNMEFTFEYVRGAGDRSARN